MGCKFVTIYTNMVIPPIDRAKSVLESEDILCNVKGYDMTRPQLSFGTTIELQVPEKDKEKAEKIIKALGIK